jgi:hypothetical protein
MFGSLSTYYRLKDDEKPDKYAMHEYYNVIKFMDDSDANRLYSDIVGNFSFFPKIPEIKECAEKYRKAKTTYKNDNFCYVCCNVGIIDYYKRGIDPFPDVEYRFVAYCPYCDSGKNYQSSRTPSIDRIFLPEQIKEIEQRNFQKFGNLPKAEKTKSKAIVETFIKAMCE